MIQVVLVLVSGCVIVDIDYDDVVVYGGVVCRLRLRLLLCC